MTITLSEARKQLSREIGDYWDSTTTSGGSSTTVVDTALKAKSNDWISDAPQEMSDLITSGTYIDEERKISSLDNTSGTLTTLAHGGTIATAVTYEVHRMFSASEKRLALIKSAKDAFPAIFKKVRDVTKQIDSDDITTGIDISALGLLNNTPSRISQAATATATDKDWVVLRNWHIESDGKLYLHEGTSDYYLKIEGIGYLDFLSVTTPYPVSTAWTATIAIDIPQLYILTAQAVMYLYVQMIMPNYTSGERDQFAKILQYWQTELADRKGRYAMVPPSPTVDWGIASQ
jgi:hypothetical protein